MAQATLFDNLLVTGLLIFAAVALVALAVIIVRNSKTKK